MVDRDGYVLPARRVTLAAGRFVRLALARPPSPLWLFVAQRGASAMLFVFVLFGCAGGMGFTPGTPLCVGVTR